MDGLNISTRTGDGSAQVLPEAGLLNLYGNILAKRQAKHQAEQQALASDLSKVKPDGLRNDADRKVFFDKYSGVKDLAAQIPYEKDSWKKAQLKAQVDQGLLELNDYAGQSRQVGADEHAMKLKLADPMQRHNYTDDSVNSLLSNTQLSLDDPRFNKDFTTTLQRQVDHSKIDENIKKIHQDQLSKAQWSNDISEPGVVKQGNKTGVNVYQTRNVPVENILSTDAHNYDLNDDIKKSYQDRYPNLVGANDAETKILRVRQAAIDRGDIANNNGMLVSNLTDKKAKGFKPDWQPDKFYAHQAYEQAHPKTGSSQGEAIPIPQFDIPYNGGKQGANVRVNDYVPVNGATINLAGSPSYNLSSGKKDEQNLSSGDYQLVGVSNVPFIKQGYQLSGTISQPDFAQSHPEAVEHKPMLHVQTKNPITGINQDKFVPFDRLPANVPKAVKTALSNFKPSTGEQAMRTVIKASDIATKAAAAGYSVKEYTDLLKQKGIKIQ